MWSPGNVRLILIASGIVFLIITALIAMWARRIPDVLHVPEAEETPAPVEPRT